jgi:hypothetical protein
MWRFRHTSHLQRISRAAEDPRQQACVVASISHASQVASTRGFVSGLTFTGDVVPTALQGRDDVLGVTFYNVGISSADSSTNTRRPEFANPTGGPRRVLHHGINPAS